MRKILWNRRKTLLTMLCLFSFITILLQMPTLLESFNTINYIIWPLLGITALVINELKFRTTRFGMLFLAVGCYLFVYCVVCYIIRGTHLNSTYLNNIILPLGLYWIGVQCGGKQKQDIDNVAKTYILATLVLAIWVHSNTFMSVATWLNTSLYMYGSKNSLAQILSCAIMMCVYMFNRNKKRRYIFFAIYFFVLICFLQCRTAILGVAVVLLVHAISNDKKRWSKILIGVVAIALLLSIDEVRIFAQKALGLYGNKLKSLDNFSSGRVFLYQEAFSVFQRNTLWGYGKWYVDNMYLSILTELGIFGATPVIVFIIYLFRSNYKKNMSQPTDLNGLLSNCSIYFFVTSFFEGLPPFGPGSCCFILWLLCGFRDSLEGNLRDAKQIMPSTGEMKQLSGD